MEMKMISFHVYILFFFIYMSITTPGILAKDEFHSCLTTSGVGNFTKFSTRPSSDYHRLFYLPMQNLMFAKPKLPKPFTIIFPRNKQELVKSVICCRQWSWTIRIRSGGHSFEGLSHIADTPFVIIDLMNLNQVSIDLETNTAWVESGATLGELYYAIAKSSDSLAFPGGWCPTVGTGGQISGGGLGLMTRKYGLAADNVVDAVLVSADGEVLDRKTMGEDVFWAIRGGGGGVWGAIYAWKIQLVTVPTVVTAIGIPRNGTKLEMSKLLHKWQTVAPQLEDDFSLAVMIRAEETKPWLKFFGLYLGNRSAAISSTNKAFPELNISAAEFQEMSWIESFAYLAELENVTELKDRFSAFDKSHFRVKIDYVRKPIPLEGINGALNILEKQPNAFLVLNGQGGVMNKITSDAIPFPHRSSNLFTMDYIVVWEEEEDWKSGEFISWLQKFYNYMTPYVSKDPRVGYVNYVDLDLGQNDWRNSSMTGFHAVEMARIWGEKYFLSNYDRLVYAKMLIDPENVFSHPQSIPPLPRISFEEGGTVACNKGQLYSSSGQPYGFDQSRT